MIKQMPMPEHYNASKAPQRFDVDYNAVVASARSFAKKHGIQTASTDKTKVCLMPIDMQITFCDPGANQLPVTGAVGDCQRTAEFIYRNLPYITEIAPTLDTHTTMQIFHEIFLVDDKGNCPPPNTPITAKDIKDGKWKINPPVATAIVNSNYMWLQRYLEHYASVLAGTDKQCLMVWTYHAKLGSQGHALMPILEEAIFFHEIARVSPAQFMIKGGNPLTENYSVFKPEVLTAHDGTKISQKSAAFLDKMLSFDMIIIPGEAASHCVAWSIDDLLNEIMVKDRTLAEKVYILEDCTSPVVIIPGHPVLDFTPKAKEAFAKFKAAGMHLVKSTDPIDEWPDSPLK